MSDPRHLGFNSCKVMRDMLEVRDLKQWFHILWRFTRNHRLRNEILPTAHTPFLLMLYYWPICLFNRNFDVI